MRFWIITIFVILICIVAIYFIVKNMNKKLEKLLVCTTNNKNKKTCYVCKICGCPCFKGDNMCPDCLTPIPKDYF